MNRKQRVTARRPRGKSRATFVVRRRHRPRMGTIRHESASACREPL
ncbi:MAG: hypothetical protein WD066_08135 [Planctomycetaceae bacterium]